MKALKNILVISRSTQNCQAAVRQAIVLAKTFGAHLSILHLMRDPFGVRGWNLPITSLKSDYEGLVKKAKEELDGIIAAEKTEGLGVTEWIKEGDPVDEVLKVFQEQQFDLMVTTAHEEGRLEHLLFGRANAELIRRMPCSIFLVKDGE